MTTPLHRRPPFRRLPGAATAAVAAGLLALSTAGPARADTNDNVADPPLACAASLLALDTGRICRTEQRVTQEIDKRGTSDAGLIGFLDVVVPAEVTALP
ncbi:hypothetical protein V1J52_01160 [Streptomyces sp. TRM 70351]|uniref:hypothetical protein n=1 Tax=Streptomyces sp. TRM 70351 TaxID=3116552 RepID=UPI002E7B2471|nr:hypothetical protein [Streptomyces sp. TRM 70351]MEE1926802.1 hypothetical protein [Streptomyces sp. TRM 70351]